MGVPWFGMGCSGAVAGDTVNIYDNGELLGSTTANPDGTWSYTPTATLAQGEHDMQASAVDPAGNEGAKSNVFDLVVDTTGPAAVPAITSLADDTPPAGDWATNDAAPTFFGTLTAPLADGDILQIQIDGGNWVDVSVAAGSTDWFYGTGDLALGDHTVNVRTLDVAGNANNAWQPFEITDANTDPLAITDGSGWFPNGDSLGNSDLGTDQVFVAYDADSNITAVEVDFYPVGDYTTNNPLFTASQQLADELGLQFSIYQSTISGNGRGPDGQILTAVDGVILDISSQTPGGVISNEAVNELLNTVGMTRDSGTWPTDLASRLEMIVVDSGGAVLKHKLI